jgi:hypothetical protein
MKCVIKIDETGNIAAHPENHPMILEVFLHAYPNIDISGDDPPDGYNWFIRKNQFYQEDIANSLSTLTVTQLIDVRYTRLDEKTYHDEYFIRDLTTDELNLKIQRLKENPPTPIKSWTLETDTYFWIPPVPRPKDGNGPYRWDESTTSWVKCVEEEQPTPAKISTAFTPESALPKPPVANTSNTITANT